MATKEKIKKKKKTQPSPATKRKPKSASKHHDNEAFDDDQETLGTETVVSHEDLQGSQVSVRSASADNIQDNTAQNEDEGSIPTPQQSSSGPQTSLSESKKTKKDHVDQKLGKGKDKKRAPSPEQKTEKAMGSAVSLRSNVSRASREAWVERKEEDVKDNDPSTSSKAGDIVTLKESTKVKREDGLKGVKVEVVEDCPEKHAYIPYLYARNCIAKISEDMAAMKTKHIIIVESIQEHYGVIESETQEQFNMFVLCMREEYSSKRHAFRQVIDTHKVELDKKEKYWNEMLTSLAERNNRLLKEKKMLLVHSKTEIERMEKEKEELEKQYAEREPPKPAVIPGAWEDERKVLQDQLDNEKATSANLREQLANQSTEIQMVESTSHVKSEVKTEGSKETSEYKPGALATASLVLTTKEVNEQMEKERKAMAAERDGLTEERTKFDEEREGFAIERRKWMDKIAELETQLASKSVSSEKWHVKHDELKGRLAEAAGYQARFIELEGQYTALAALVNNSNTDDALKTELGKVEEERAMMMGEKAKLDKDIAQWEKDFEKKNKRKPTDDDKPDSVQEMYTSRDEVTYMVNSLQTKENTYREVEKGKAPDPPEISHVPVDTRDPKVISVKVEVPDPTVVQELEKSQSDLVLARSEVTQLQQQITDLRSEISDQNQQLATQRQRVAELEHEVAKLKAEGVAGGLTGTAIGGANVSEEELESLKKENRELRRDMKKMIKQYERLAAMKQADGASTGGTGDGADDTAAAMGLLDNKIADLESENEALKEERANLREKVKTITETITVTQFEDNKKTVEEKDKKIDDLLQELTKLREQNVSMAKDMKKMVKSHMKTKARLDELASIEKAAKLLEIVAMLVHEIHSTVPDAATQVNDRLNASVQEVGQSKERLDEKQALYQKWLDQYQKQHGKAPGKGDRDADGTRIHGDWEEAKAMFQDRHLHMSALQLMKTGDITAAVGKSDDTDNKAEIEIASLEKALAVADNRMIDLEASNRNMQADRDRYKDRVEDLESMVRDMEKQLKLNQALMADSQSTAEMTGQLSELQRKSDSFESELMQERMSHVSTRDELETLRKQLDTVKEELENERVGADGRIQATKLGLEQQLTVKDEELSALKARNEQLQQDKLSKLPPDAAAEVKALQDQLRQLEADQSGSKSSTAALTAQIAELNTKLETASKNLETTRAANRELEAKVKAGRSEKDREAKKISRHMEEKQQKAFSEDKQRIALLVKRVKELEAHAGKSHVPVPVPVGGGGGSHASDAEVMKLKREIKDQEAQIKRLEKELRLGGGAAVSAKDAVAEKSKMAKAEKVLKELEKRLDHEKEKSSQIMDGLKAADEENKTLKKDLDEQHRVNAKLGAELKTIGVAAKEGIEAAAKVKNLEGENKKLSEENVTLTKNFESERVLRKKYYNMVEDMKGKIRVYCRARPMSKSELDRGNKAVLNSADEYSISVESNRGLKEFQYDQVFMENSTQEKIFEDTNNLIQSAMDGYNVCIFAYGQTGSGKTFTMIGDKEQRFPGIAPRAFNRIFEMADEMKGKFTVTVETYMLELYNDKLIDLFAKPGGGTDDKGQEKLEVKKDKKGMVYIQGSVSKGARNAKELFALFEEGSMNRHVASTKMNAESSRSHLIVGIILESTNKNTGNVTKGKLSLVDLAGSERVAKTQAGAEQLKEAMSINKSLSALGDVISALSSDQQFIPYRNNKLTMVMQDSLGGNAKTLMFVNISPADYNMEETVISLTYASRVKLITNDASKNADNKEIARLKNVIALMKKGENVDVDDEI